MLLVKVPRLLPSSELAVVGTGWLLPVLLLLLHLPEGDGATRHRASDPLARPSSGLRGRTDIAIELVLGVRLLPVLG